MGKIGVILIIIAIILGIGLLVTGIMIIAQKGNSKDNLDSSKFLSVYLMAKDYGTKEGINANYLISYKDKESNVQFSKGNLQKGSWAEIKNFPRDKLIDIYVWDSDYYLAHLNKNFTYIERENNVSKNPIEVKKVGKLKIKQIGKLTKDKTKIIFNLTAIQGSYNKIGAVMRWTPGILDVNLIHDAIRCETGVWENKSNNEYKCGDYYETCENVVGINCYPFEPKMPTRFVGITDKTIYLGNELNNGETLTFSLDVKTLESVNILDGIEIIFFDHDKRWNEYTQSWTTFPEYEGEDIGGEDYKHTIDFQR